MTQQDLMSAYWRIVNAGVPDVPTLLQEVLDTRTPEHREQFLLAVDEAYRGAVWFGGLDPLAEITLVVV